LHKSLLPGFATSLSISLKKTRTPTTRASLVETPVLWVGRICIFYALLKTGFVGSPSNPILSGFNSLTILAFFFYWG